MEHIEGLSEGEWSSFSGMFSTDETDFMAQLLGNYSVPNDHEAGSTLTLGTLSSLWPGHEAAASVNVNGSDHESSYYCSDTVNSSLICYPQGSSYSSGSSSLLLPSSGHSHHGHYYLSNSNPILVTNSDSLSMDFSMVHPSIQVFTESPMEEDSCLNEEMSSDSAHESGASPEAAAISLREKKLQQLKRRSVMLEPNVNTEDKSEYPRKKPRVASEAQRTKKNAQSKKTQKLNLNSNDEEENGATNGQASSSDCSEDDSNASQEINGARATSSSKGSEALNLLKGKTRASRGSATDPQSLYARKRRERINERLRILQNLVPNGTKVDISTMLEEAVQYVKFLQLQIKLLSSDDLWMYAPIAYNGMDIGLDLKLSTTR